MHSLWTISRLLTINCRFRFCAAKTALQKRFNTTFLHVIRFYTQKTPSHEKSKKVLDNQRPPERNRCCRVRPLSLTVGAFLLGGESREKPMSLSPADVQAGFDAVWSLFEHVVIRLAAGVALCDLLFRLVLGFSLANYLRRIWRRRLPTESDKPSASDATQPVPKAATPGPVGSQASVEPSAPPSAMYRTLVGGAAPSTPSPAKPQVRGVRVPRGVSRRQMRQCPCCGSVRPTRGGGRVAKLRKTGPVVIPVRKHPSKAA